MCWYADLEDRKVRLRRDAERHGDERTQLAPLWRRELRADIGDPLAVAHDVDQLAAVIGQFGARDISEPRTPRFEATTLAMPERLVVSWTLA
jgi:hypothetical protein